MKTITITLDFESEENMNIYECHFNLSFVALHPHLRPFLSAHHISWDVS